MKVVLTRSALADLETIGDWIAKDSPQRALSFVHLLRDRCMQLADMPLAFPLVPRFESLRVRRRPVGDYLIFYRVTPDHLEILHVLHGARDYGELLFSPA